MDSAIDAGTSPDVSGDALVAPRDTPRQDVGTDAGRSTGPLDPTPPRATYLASAGPADVVLDWERHRIFLSQGSSGTVEVVNLVSGEVSVVNTGYRAENMHFDPYRDEVVISLPNGEHSPYRFDANGYVGVIDALTLEARVVADVPVDPWEIVSDGEGLAHTVGGSGQWTYVATVNLDSGDVRLSTSQIRGQSSIELHPSRTHAYTADIDLSPSDIQRVALGFEAGVEYDSPYHGDYEMCGALRIDPRGRTIYTRCGNVFLATNVRGTDMTWTGTLGSTWVDLAFEPTGAYVYVARELSPAIHVHDAVTFARVASISLARAPRYLRTGRDYVVAISPMLGGAAQLEVRVLDLPMP